MSTPHLSVVIATHQRHASLRRLLDELSLQTLLPAAFEVVVVDDGSTPPVAERLADTRFPFALQLLEQENQGAAAARHRGATAARGEWLVFVDDDMALPRSFLAAHLAAQREHPNAVVLGRMRSPPERLPLFERWHQAMLDAMAAALARPGATPRGNQLYTGNVSLRRDAYLASGGFDPSLGHSEDAELGLRLEAQGCRFVFSEAAWSIHHSDHTSLDRWLWRSFQYGRFDARIGEKHPQVPHADPWRFLFELNPLSRPLLVGTLAAPRLAEQLSRRLMAVAAAAEGVRLERAALALTTLVFGLQYFRGLREEAGSGTAAAREVARHVVDRRMRSGVVTIARDVARAVAADQRTLQRYEAKYGHRSPSGGSLAADVTSKIGLQLLAAYRLMRALHAHGHAGAAKVVSRLIRHLYGSDLHWEAELAPGVMVVHGMGMAISHAARVDEGCILFHHVTLGMGTDPLTGATGAPTLERDVHVGPGATLLGPIRIGQGSKIMAGAVVTEHVPAGSVVRVPAPAVTSRSHRNVVASAAAGASLSPPGHAATGD